jgi:hypothetical protein
LETKWRLQQVLVESYEAEAEAEDEAVGSRESESALLLR